MNELEPLRYVVRISGKNRDGVSFNGTGFLVSSKGHVATCRHVVFPPPDYKLAAEILVHLPYPYNKPANYQVCDSLENHDLALLESIVPLTTPTPCASLHSNRCNDTHPGDNATVWGFSTAQYYTAPQHIPCTIRGFDEQHGRIGLSGNINTGDSGAPVINTDEKVIGVTNAKDRMKDGHAQAIPISLLTDLLQKNGIDLFKNGETESKPLGELPAVSENFTGRDEDVERVLEQLSRHRIVTITGLGGIGKSELAKKVAHEAREPEWASDGMHYVDLQGATDANAIMSILVTGLGLQSAKDAADLAKKLAGRCFYIFDDLYSALVKDGEGVWVLVDALYRYSEPARFLLTCRELVGDPAVTHPLPLDKLRPPHDADLFRKLANACRYKWREGDEERLKGLLREGDGLDGYPLAINIAANLLNPTVNLSLQEVMEQWETCRTAALQLPGAPHRRLTSVDFSLDLSVKHLPEEANTRTLFSLFALLPTGATAEMLKAMMDGSWFQAVMLLVSRSLVQKRDERYVMLVPVREFAVRFLTDTCAPFRQKLDAYLLTLTEQWCGDDEAWIKRTGKAVLLLSTELPNLHAAMDRAKARADNLFIAKLTSALSRFYDFALTGAEAVQRLQDGTAAAHVVGDTLHEAYCMQNLGHVHLRLSEYKQARARYEEALSLFRSIGDRQGEANCIKGEGEMCWLLVEYTQARARYEEALSLFRSIGDRQGEANCIRSLGDVYGMVTRYKQGQACYEEALSLFRSIGDRRGEANCIQRLGDMHRGLAEYKQAQARYEDALPLFHSIGSRVGEANCLTGLGDVHRMLGEYEQGRVRYEDALKLLQSVGARHDVAGVLWKMGQLYATEGYREKAIQLMEQTARLYDDIGIVHWADRARKKIEAWQQEEK